MKERPNEHASGANFEFEALRAANNYRRALAAEFGPHLHGRVLEVGAGIGQITEALRQLPAISRLAAIEPDPAFCREFRKAFPTHPLTEGTIESLEDREAWDGIVSVNVLEHILADEEELGAYGKLLRSKRGVLCLFVPARQEIYAPIDKEFGHHRRYSKPELRRKLGKAGFEVLRLEYFNCIGYFAWWLSFCVFRKRGLHAGSVRFFDRLIFPPMYALEKRVCAPPLGQSLIAVARAAEHVTGRR